MTSSGDALRILSPLLSARDILHLGLVNQHMFDLVNNYVTVFPGNLSWTVAARMVGLRRCTGIISITPRENLARIMHIEQGTINIVHHPSKSPSAIYEAWLAYFSGPCGRFDHYAHAVYDNNQIQFMLQQRILTTHSHRGTVMAQKLTKITSIGLALAPNYQHVALPDKILKQAYKWRNLRGLDLLPTQCPNISPLRLLVHSDLALASIRCLYHNPSNYRQRDVCWVQQHLVINRCLEHLEQMAADKIVCAKPVFLDIPLPIESYDLILQVFPHVRSLILVVNNPLDIPTRDGVCIQGYHKAGLCLW